ncbi:hypothetical protein ACFSJQ_18005 [Vibrio olivae]|uniref:Transposase n=1 Tax=Vibrio olivae TaxID=1243002 RepID=A0ABV5HPB6_9VIBR
MDQDKFTNIYRLPNALQVRIGQWQKTLKGTSDIVLHQALQERNQYFRRTKNWFPSGWNVALFDEKDFSITEHGKYIQTAMRTMIDRKVSYKRVYLSRVPLDEAMPKLVKYKQEWLAKHNRIARKYNQIKKKQFMRFATEEVETLYPSIPKGEFDKALWNKLVVQDLGPAKKYDNPYFVKKSVF